MFMRFLQFYSHRKLKRLCFQFVVFSSDTSFKILLNTSSGHTLTWAIFLLLLFATFVCLKEENYSLNVI